MVRIELFYHELDMARPLTSFRSLLERHICEAFPDTIIQQHPDLYSLRFFLCFIFLINTWHCIFVHCLFPQPEGEQLESCRFLPCYMPSTLRVPARSVYPVKDLIRLPISPSTHPNISPSFSKCQPQSRRHDGCCVMGERQTWDRCGFCSWRERYQAEVCIQNTKLCLR